VRLLPVAQKVRWGRFCGTVAILRQTAMATVLAQKKQQAVTSAMLMQLMAVVFRFISSMRGLSVSSAFFQFKT
jgi:hypothetical protein